MGDRPWVFYPALIAAAVLAMALAERAGRFAGGLRRRGADVSPVRASPCPLADALYRSSTGVPIVGSMAAPTYSYRAARENPAAFAMWWFYYLNEWIRDDGVRGAIEKPDPEKKLPFVLVPGAAAACSTRPSASTPPASAGRRSRPTRATVSASSRSASSQTFGPTLRDGEKPWPELLQALFDRHASCGRPVEVVNAGTEAYTLEDNLERMRRDILPLKPDLIVSTHGMNGLLALGLRQQAEPNEPGVRPRASALIGRAVLTIERAVHDWRTRNAPHPAAPPPLSDEALLRAATPRPIASSSRSVASERRPRRARDVEHGGRTRARPARSRISTAPCSSRSTTSSPPTPPTTGWCGFSRRRAASR